MRAEEPVKIRPHSPGIVGVIASAEDLRLARRMSSPPDLFELRLDSLYRETGIGKKLSTLGAPLIITARHPAEGGKNSLSSNVRRDLLLRFLPVARDVDVELRSVAALRMVLDRARKLRVDTIISFHDLRCTPRLGSLRAKAAQAARLRPTIFKVATRTHTAVDFSRLLQFIATHPRQLSIAAMGVGRLGAISRVALAQCGSALIYCSLGHTKLEGQLSVDRFRTMLAELTPRTQ